MKRRGACNAELYMIHETCYLPGFAGEAEINTSQSTVVGFGQIDTTPYMPWMNSVRPQFIRTWVYEDVLENPQIWAVGDSDGNILYAWEAESAITQWNNELNPIATKGNNGELIVPAGGAVKRLLFPGYSGNESSPDVLDVLEDEAETAAEPDWLAGSPFQYITGANLVGALWRWLSCASGLSMEDSLRTQKNRLSIATRDRMYTLQWLRAASMIICNHFGQTCIPVLMQRCRMDLTNGMLILKT